MDGGGSSSEEDRRERKRERKRKEKRRRRSSDEESPRRSRYPRSTVPTKRRSKSMWDVRPEDVPKDSLALLPRTRREDGEGDSVANLRNTRHARRMYIGGIDVVSEMELKLFFDDVLQKIVPQDVDGRVVSVYVNNDKRFAFVELNTIELTTACMALDGIEFRGIPLRIRRPNDYQPHLVTDEKEPPKLNLNQVNLLLAGGAQTPSNNPGTVGNTGISSMISDGPNKVFVGGIPHHLTDENIVDLLQSAGKLRALKIVKDSTGQVSKGYCFCEYCDAQVTDTAIESLNGLPIGDRVLTVRRSDPKYQRGPQAGVNLSPSGGGGSSSVNEELKPPTRVLVFMNMVTDEDLMDDKEYQEILLDVREECEGFGTVLSVEIPRPDSQGVMSPGVGKVFVEFSTSQAALQARLKLEGRKFAQRVVECDFLEEDRYARKDFD